MLTLSIVKLVKLFGRSVKPITELQLDLPTRITEFSTTTEPLAYGQERKKLPPIKFELATGQLSEGAPTEETL